MRDLVFTVLLLLLFLPFKLIAQRGNVLVNNYPNSLYGGNTLNTDVAQDSRGVIYIANWEGVIEYDGYYWRTIPINEGVTQELEVSDEGILYILTDNDFGYISFYQTIEPQFHSLLKNSDIEIDIPPLHNLIIHQNNVYFQSVNKLYKYDGKKVSEISRVNLQATVGKLFELNNTLYLTANSIDSNNVSITYLYKLINDKFSSVDTFSKDIDIAHNFINKDTLLLGSFEGSLFTYPKVPVNSVSEITLNEIDKVLSKYGTELNLLQLDSSYLLGSYSAGLFVFDKNFHPTHNITSDKDNILSNRVKSINLDNVNNIWLSSLDGVSKINFKSTITYWDKNNGLKGKPWKIVRNKNMWYILTTFGLQTMNANSSKITSLSDNYYNTDIFFYSKQNKLFTTDFSISRGNSIISLDDTVLYPMQVKNSESLTDNPVKSFFQDPADSNLIWLVLYKGITTLKKEGDSWIIQNTIVEGFDFQVKYSEYIVSDHYGNIWLSYYAGESKNLNTFVCIKRDSINNKFIAKTHINDKDKYWTIPNLLGEKLTFGRCYFDFNTEEFIIDDLLWNKCDSYFSHISRLYDAGAGNIWVQGISKKTGDLIVHRLDRMRNSFVVNMHTLSDIPEESYYIINCEKNGNVWIGTTQKLYLYQPKTISSIKKTPFHTLIRNVKVGKDSVLFLGSYTKKIRDSLYVAIATSDQSETPEIEYNSNNITFEFASPFMLKEQAIEYQYYLEGLEDDWSNWSSKEHSKYYNSLWEGEYVFHVRSKNLYNEISSEATYTFTILPPWYRSIWAYLIYIILFLFLSYVFIVFYTSYLKERNKNLEKIIKERTIEVEKKNIILQQNKIDLQNKTEELKELDKVKSKFYINISHELRTPLTLIMSPIYQILRENRSLPQPVIDNLKVVERNGKNLKTLIDDILDLSKLESEKLQLKEQPTEVISFIKELYSNFQVLAQHLEIEYKFECYLPSTWKWVDQLKLGKIINNLLSNAFKYTPSGGVIILSVKVDEELKIDVIDTGLGISEEELPLIFNRFYQVKQNSQSLQGGTGIGLALCKELTKMMNGSLTATSIPKKGSRFILTLPLRNAGTIENENSDIVVISDNYEKSELLVTQKDKSKFSILIVEDNLDMQNFIVSLLKDDYDVHTANNGQKALELLKQEKVNFHTIISDIMMPEMDGITLLQNLKSQDAWRAIPVIMLTAMGKEEIKLSALRIGVDDYILKPFLNEELKARLYNIIKRYVSKLEWKDVDVSLSVDQDKPKLQELNIEITSEEMEWLANVEAYILKELENYQFTLEDLADAFCLSKKQFGRKIKKITGLSPSHYQREILLQIAREKLENESVESIKSLSYSLGFKTQHYFSKLYEQRFGRKPSHYLNK